MSRPRGQVLVLAIVLILFIFMGAGALLSSSLSRVITEQRLSLTEQAHGAAEAGIERALYELNATQGQWTGGTEAVGNSQVDTSIAALPDGRKEITAVGTVQKTSVTLRVQASDQPVSDQAEFFYALHVGGGGVRMDNNSTVQGNIVSAGSVAAGNGARVTGSVAVSGAGNQIDNLDLGDSAHVHTLKNSTVGTDAKTQITDRTNITRDAYAESISDSNVGRDLYANAITRTTVGGTTYPGNGIPPPESIPFPIDDEMLNQWQEAGEDGETINGDYVLSNGQSASLGPNRINGDMYIDNNAVLTVTGTLWITGVTTFKNGSTVKLDPGYGNKGGVLIGYNPDDPASNGTFVVENGAIVQGSGSPNSMILLVSRNTGSGNTAITAANNSSSMVVYVPYATVKVDNNATLNAVTAYQLELKNNASVVYLAGLSSGEFTSGPGGVWKLLPGTFEID